MAENKTDTRTFTQLFSALAQEMVQNRSQNGLGLTRLQGLALRSVNQRPGITMTELAQQIGITNPQLTRIVTTLEDRGLVKREHNPENRRVVNVQSTEQGVALIAQNVEAVAARYDQALQTLTPAEQTTLVRDLQTSMRLMTKAGILKGLKQPVAADQSPAPK
ncbi:MarR family transcriptional regulator [Lacticaseibacillus camelliae]|uniref:HTH marR-type domain-containing protein n=2 Tax=Lacticaseibacillus camelliae TaxID=381742 RepID=A0A0R2EQV2_9LACO|nr:MarR family transcriptional regulator [Lacticaseibacillus camelliae]KRN18681.1 hypothetical protein FC75_GL000449 [Lacticaseibacillus camelliae DSM 22697 = JCM 13995]